MVTIRELELSAGEPPLVEGMYPLHELRSAGASSVG